MEFKPQVFPGLFGEGCAADSRRSEFDSKNSIIVNTESKVDVVFIGDSITHAWELNAYFRDFGFVVNRGISGDVVENVARRFEADAAQLNPAVCVILIGINNMGIYEMEPPYKEKELIALFEEKYRFMLDMAKERGIKTVICSVLPVRDGVLPHIEERNGMVLEFNKILVALADEYSCEYVDYHSRFTDNDGRTMKEGLSHDGLHPHVYGYNIMAEAVRPAIEKLIK